MVDVTLDKDVIDIPDHGWIPFVTFSVPQVAAVGLKEAQAREKGIDVAQGRASLWQGYLL